MVTGGGVAAGDGVARGGRRGEAQAGGNGTGGDGDRRGGQSPQPTVRMRMMRHGIQSLCR